MLKPIKPAEVFPPGDYIREELKERGWTQGDFARVLGRPLQTVNEIINHRKRITAETAKAIGLALGTGPEVWINLQSYYDLHSTPDADPRIERRAAAMAK
jgi:HTH-type transcriptional regulator/antitoxin HigA